MDFLTLNRSAEAKTLDIEISFRSAARTSDFDPATQDVVAVPPSRHNQWAEGRLHHCSYTGVKNNFSTATPITRPATGSEPGE